ncbi:hypothetical protein K461DRAFT_279051 [Myriangium duriaei CBS 260.36]|uniref:JmjC domain-containing protein n=1 Tax=Myriangium duriaei CBS 260.36 TaxID=1168546 RepID=A0A9P4IXP0_9PEZI|nr:hypothetical protein K461DRAFT_279051 [Myriangium duriaei CBS 260.36]
MVSTDGAITPCHVDVAGLWIMVIMVTGNKYWMFPKKGLKARQAWRNRRQDNFVARQLEAVPSEMCGVNLRSGDAILQPPGTLHTVLTLSKSCAICYQFYHPRTMHLSIDAVSKQIRRKQIESDDLEPKHLQKLEFCIGFIRALSLPKIAYILLDEAIERMLKKLKGNGGEGIDYPAPDFVKKYDRRHWRPSIKDLKVFPDWVEGLAQQYSCENRPSFAYWIALVKFVAIARAYLVQRHLGSTLDIEILRSTWTKPGLHDIGVLKRKRSITDESVESRVDSLFDGENDIDLDLYEHGLSDGLDHFDY